MTDARAMWTLFEPVHGITYFTEEALAAFEAAGLRGFWRGYFAGRATPLGTRLPAVVTGVLQTFSPAFVARAVPGIYELITPEDALRVRLDGAVTSLRRILAGQEDAVDTAAGLLTEAIEHLDCSGRPLAAGNAELPLPQDPFGRLWHCATVLREHRGDGHFAAWTAAGIDGCEATVLRCALDLSRDVMQPIRGWTDEQWSDAQARLAGRGLLDPDGTVTAIGQETHNAIEAATDLAAARPWDRLGAAAAAELGSVLLPIARACVAAMNRPSPLNVPPPGSVTRA
jgi:ElaB/YqjD/DUF883 family membrane-anchored ribosome-binding protein